jgi:predicted Zn-dependent protease
MIVEALDAGQTASALSAAQDLRRRAPDRPSASVTLGYVLLRQQRYDDACAVWREGLAQSTEPVPIALLKNNIAFAKAMRGRADDLADAERLSAEALDALPRSGAVKGTRGAILVRQGRAAEAIPLLERALVLGHDGTDRASTRLFLARALRMVGRLDESVACRAEAQRLDPQHPLLDWAASDASLEAVTSS